MVSTLGCLRCGILDTLYDKGDEHVLAVILTMALSEVNATAAADAEFAVQTRVAELEATLQFLVENLQVPCGVDAFPQMLNLLAELPDWKH